eukprot:Lankesteria_metandrocarpae@DN8718_c0_g1_i1.p1
MYCTSIQNNCRFGVVVSTGLVAHTIHKREYYVIVQFYVLQCIMLQCTLSNTSMYICIRRCVPARELRNLLCDCVCRSTTGGMIVLRVVRLKDQQLFMFLMSFNIQHDHQWFFEMAHPSLAATAT